MARTNAHFKVLLITSRIFLSQATVALAYLLILTSCGKDEDPEMDTTSTLEGIIWIQTSYEYIDCNSDDNNGGATLVCTDEDCQSVLFQNGTARYTELVNGTTSTFDFRYTVSGDSEFSVGGLTATYEINDNVLTVRSFDANDGCTLVEEYQGS